MSQYSPAQKIAQLRGQANDAVGEKQSSRVVLIQAFQGLQNVIKCRPGAISELNISGQDGKIIAMIRPMEDSQKSQKPFDLLSDSEPPKDVPRQRKLIHSDARIKIHKEIIKLGAGLDKPAKYDLISFRLERMDDELTFAFSEGVSWQQRNLGLGEAGAGVADDLMTHLRRGECSLFTVQNRNQKDRKQIDSTEIFLIQVRDWTTVIDMDGDLRWMKTIQRRGEGADRCGLNDFLKVTASIRRGQHLLYQHEGQLIISCSQPQIPSCLKKVLANMKHNQLCNVQVQEGFLREEQLTGLKEKLKQNSTDLIHLSVEVVKLTKVFDLFGDGKVLRHVLEEGVSQLRPIKSCQVRFTAEITANGQTLLLDQCCFLDQRGLSKLLKRILLRSHQKQFSQVRCFQPRYIDRGADRKMLEQALGSVPRCTVYKVRLVDIVTGRPSYSLSLQQKLTESRRTKAIAVGLLNQHNYRKAQKIFFNNAKSFQYEKERSQQMTQDYIASMLNLSLCHLKLGQFQHLIEVCDKILEILPENQKAMLRKIYALEATKDYEACLKLIDSAGPIQGLEQTRLRVKKLHVEDRKRQNALFGKMLS